MDNKRFNLASHWAELGASCQKICLKEIDFRDLMVITEGWNSTRQFRLLEVRENMIKENQATIQPIEEQLTQTGHTQIPSGSQGAGQICSPVASHHSETNRSVAKSHHSSQSQEVSKRRQGYNGKNKTTFSQRRRESDPMCHRGSWTDKQELPGTQQPGNSLGRLQKNKENNNEEMNISQNNASTKMR
ncbi:hypothetical protein O181_057688 [Austropuccinia psidii MF-1]|uniref:Uncharacterized protein n=1 Tax=Austropuccinia psidii MF-1 TaxID=1389203 RepID=A0A9Q3HUR4_9BASI|nr:hypothetical protein [Austropuccinia psidii MF-1]